MDDKLQVLTDKIYQEGIEQAEKKAEEIVHHAREKADATIKDSQAQAKKIVEDATREAESVRSNINSELKLAGSQMITSLKQEISKVITGDVIDESVSGAMLDADFIKQMLLDIIKKWETLDKAPSLDVILSDNLKDKVESAYLKSASKKIKEINISFDGKLSNGFRIKEHGKSYEVTFTEDDFAQFFKIYLRKVTYHKLFDQ
jgi:V/A-type H+/Na+-transporting ATPase subunit E